ncbi:hypothetical protein MCEMAEM6B_02373 [Mycobacteriaceae bacterium]
MIQPAVTPIADYEPPADRGAAGLLAISAQPPPTVEQPAPAQPGRGSGNTDHSARAAAIFADAALRRVLEVIDRRRSLAQLRPLLDGALVDTLLPAARRGDGVGSARHGDGVGSARLRRVRAQSVRADGTAAEVAANYTRGERVHAIACRVEQITGATGPRWQVVALHLG